MQTRVDKQTARNYPDDDKEFLYFVGKLHWWSLSNNGRTSWRARIGLRQLEDTPAMDNIIPGKLLVYLFHTMGTRARSLLTSTTAADPGRYLTIISDISDTKASQMRHLSISSAPTNPPISRTTRARSTKRGHMVRKQHKSGLGPA